MTVGELQDILSAFNNKEYIEIEIYDSETGEYINTDEAPTVDEDGLDLVFKARVKQNLSRGGELKLHP